jgi:hypothetical protein
MIVRFGVTQMKSAPPVLDAFQRIAQNRAYWFHAMRGKWSIRATRNIRSELTGDGWSLSSDTNKRKRNADQKSQTSETGQRRKVTTDQAIPDSHPSQLDTANTETVGSPLISLKILQV